VKKSKIAQNSLPVPCSQLRVPLPQRQFLTPTYLIYLKKSINLVKTYACDTDLAGLSAIAKRDLGIARRLD